MGDARKLAAKFVIFPSSTFRFHAPVKITLNARVISKSSSGIVMIKELISPVAVNESLLLVESELLFRVIIL
jgi:hypothetical protein